MGTKEEDSVEDNEEIGSLNLVYGVGSENGALNTFATLEMHGVTNESFWLVAEMMNAASRGTRGGPDSIA